ncbi:MAG: IS200/IS605 family transposase [Chloroflexota bacterium]|nr:IS200/IS605 family transposase [Chloroflexota bacterium]
MEPRVDGHHVHLVVYHVVWCPKRRKAVLVGMVAERLAALINDVLGEWAWEPVSLEVQPDHVHLFIRGDTRTPIHKIIRAIKGRSSRLLRQEFPALRKLPSLWTHSYYCGTAGNVSAEAISRYIEAQKGR